MSDSSYPNLGSTRWIVEIEPARGRLVLDDGSEWRLAEGERGADGWTKTTTLTVEPTLDDGEGRFVLRVEGLGPLPAALVGFGPLGRSG